MSIGTTLKAARERSGLTIAQVAEQTRMIHQLVEDIEQDDFHRIIAAVYGRGFIKLFAECVGEDPAPLVQEFNEIYSGARRPAVRTRAVQTASEEPDTVEAADAAPHRPKVRAVTVPDEEPVAAAQPAAKPAPTPSDAAGRALSPRAPRPEVKAEVKPAAEPAAEPVAESVAEPAASARPPDQEAPSSSDAAGGALPPPPPPQPEPQPAPEPEVTPPPRQEVKPVAAEVKQPPKLKDIDEGSPEADEGGLGELFDLGSRTKAEPRAEKAAANADSKGEGAKLKIPLTQQAPSWDDAPLTEGDFWQKLSNLDKWKYWKIGAALAGLCLLAVILLAVAVKLKSSRNGDAEPPVVAQSEPPAEPATPATAANGPAAEPASGGKSVYTENLVPPPDSYVD